MTAPERRAELRAGGWWDAETLVGRLACHARERPDAVAIVDGTDGRRVTFGQLQRDARRVAANLLEFGVEPGNVVTLQLPNWYASVAVALGALSAGAVVNPMLPAYRERELSYMLGLAETKVVVTPSLYRGFDHRGLVEQLRSGLPRLAAHLVLEPGKDAFDRLFGVGEADPVPVDSEAVCELMFTSGTEAEPKAVMHTECTLNANARATAAALGLDADDVVWMPAPIGHSTGFNHGLRLSVFHGQVLVLQDKWDPVHGVALVQREGCTHTLLATTFMRDVIRAGRDAGADLSSLRAFGCGGSPIPSRLVQEAAELGMACLRLYGSTETLVATWVRPGSPASKCETTDGLPLDGVEVQARDEEGLPVVGRPGEIFTRSPSTCVGFHRDPERTAVTCAADGFVRSGDIGVVDEDGYLTIVGRKKEIIIRGGQNIAPFEVETLLLRMPGVRQAAVVPLPDERLGEIACACLVLGDGGATTLDEVVGFLRGEGLAVFKLPQRLIVRGEFPVTATGKVRKHVLLEQLRRERVGLDPSS